MPTRGTVAAANAAGDRRERDGRARDGRPGPSHGDRPASPVVAWGPFEPAVHRWEHLTGRPAPAPTDDRGRLSPTFVEWMMGLPEGWVTDVPDLGRSAQLRILGNGVVPQQAAAAVAALLALEAQEAAA